MQICKFCGAVIPVGKRECEQCGKSMNQTQDKIKRCKKCGSVIGQRDKTCARCGAEIPQTSIKATRICKKCGSFVPLGKHACIKCGTVLTVTPHVSAQNKCKKCGAAIIEGSAFCNKCGASLGVNASTAKSKSSCELFSYDSLIIDQQVRGLRAADKYRILTEDGKPVGYVSQEDISGGAVAAQVLFGRGMKHLQSFSFSIYDENLKRVGGISRSSMLIDINDGAGKYIGTLKRGKLVDSQEKEIMSIRVMGALQNKIDVFDTDGKRIAAIDKQWNGVAKELLTTADKYRIEFTPGISENNKSIALSICIGFDFFH